MGDGACLGSMPRKIYLRIARSGRAASVCGSYSTMYPATALAATVYGLARYIRPGPLRPGKLRFCALITTWSGRVETPGPALMQAPQLGSITIAPAFLKTSRYPLDTQYSRVSCEPNWM